MKNYQRPEYVAVCFFFALMAIALSYFNFWFWWDRTPFSAWWAPPTFIICAASNFVLIAFAVVGLMTLADTKGK